MRGSLQLPFQTTVTEGIYSYFLRGTRTEKKRTLPSAKHWRKLCPVKGLLWNSPHVACETPDQAPSRATIVAYSLLVFLAVGPERSSTHRRFERCSRGRDPAHRRAAQELGRTLFIASR